MVAPAPQENGTILVLVAVCLTLFMLALAMSVDIGWIVLAGGQLQDAADASALAGAVELRDSGILYRAPDQSNEIPLSRDAARSYIQYQTVVNRAIDIDRNDANAITGDIVVGYIQNPLDHSSSLQTVGVSRYNSVQVTAKLTGGMNGPLALFVGGFTGVNHVEVGKRATATLDDRIAGFSLSEGEILPMLPFTAYEGSWASATDGVGDQDNYKVDDSGHVSSGSDGIPELTLYPYKSNVGIPGTQGNVGTLFVTPHVQVDSVDYQILNGMNRADLNAVNGLLLKSDGHGNFTQWLPGENWMSSTWHNDLRSIKGQKRIMPLFRSFNSHRPVSYADSAKEDIEKHLGKCAPDEPETCCSIQLYYEISGYKAVTVVDSFWPSSDSSKRFIVQPTQITTEAAAINPSMPGSGLVYGLSLTR